MKIAYFTDSYWPKVDGITVSVAEFSKRLSKKNQVKVYAPDYGGKAKGESGPFEVERYRSIKALTYKEQYLATPNIVKLLASIKNFEPEVIHIHSPATMGLMGMMAARWLKVPVVGTYHTLVSELGVYFSIKGMWGGWMGEVKERLASSGLVSDFLTEVEGAGEMVREENREEGEGFKKLAWLIVNRFYNLLDVVVAPSGAIERELVTRGVTKPVVVVSNGVDTTKFKPKKSYTDGYKIVHVGRLGYEKRVDVVLRAFGEVAERHEQARLVIAGDGPARKDLERLAADLGLTDKVKFLGMYPRDGLGEVYRGGDVFVTASPMETQGVVILEAMACGVPVVGVDKYAVPDVVKPGVTGYLAPPGDFEKLAEGIEMVLGSKKRAEKLGRAARKAAEKEDVEKSVKKVEELYVDLIRDRV